ncbi:hypothetical protein FOZ62_021630 [Perkinsus olseni]|uniref:Mitochondrial carrier n=1 Tax=Perkinsus olseni TaxID=32597 RepID=A0A7J6Q0J7_PEROL|nr:hypothetical protein FOZ62_021630 [Perkinsus olseni]
MDTLSPATPIAAAGASMITKCLLYPADTLKCRVQAGVAHRSAVTVSTLYRGLLPKLVLYVPYQSLYMTSYQFYRRTFADSVVAEKHPLLTTGAAGALAEMTGACIRLPMEVMKQRMQTGRYANLREALRSTVKSPLRFINGRIFVAQTILHDIPFGIIQWTAFETVSTQVERNRTAVTAGPWSHLVAGTLSGSIAALLTNPMDVVKTRVVTSPHSEGTPAIKNVIRSVHAESGFRGFFRGSLLRLLHVAPSNGVYLALFSFLNSTLANID